MKCLITGGLGFIGSNLARSLLRDGHDVTLLDSLVPEYGGNLFNIHGIADRVNLQFSDIRDPYAIRHLLRGKDVVFNLAGQTSHADSMTDPFTDLDINAKAQLSLLEAIRDVNPVATVVFASTRQIYGKPEYLPVDEQHPINPVDVNGINKLSGEQYHLLYNKVYGIKTVVLRLTNTYGPRMRIKDARQTFLGIWIKNLLLDLPIRVYGNGMQLRDFNYVDDVVEALRASVMAEDCHGRILNLGASDVVSLKTLAEHLVTLKCDARWELVPFPQERKNIDIGDYYGDYTLATRLLGWTPKVDLIKGLQLTTRYYRESLQNYL